MDDVLTKTPLFARHVEVGAKIIPFAGWEMPVQYVGIMAEHNTVRQQAGLFDLGHMGQVNVSGAGALDFLQYITTNDVSQLAPRQAQYSMLPNREGGAIDDILVYRRPEGEDGYMVVVNASNRHRDVTWMNQLRNELSELDVAVEDISDRTGMVAIQGPNAAAITQSITDEDLANLDYYWWRCATVGVVPLMLARTGYTGEDGFELYPSIDDVGTIWDALMEAGDSMGLKPVGLGARDTLRLEARMPLYGQELSDTISPYEAGLGFAVKLDKGDFVGRAAMAQVKENGPERCAVGFRMTERSGSPRTHYPVGIDDEVIGEVTSGAFSPTLGENIGLALISAEYAGIARPLQVEIRGKWMPAEQIQTPFYKRAS